MIGSMMPTGARLPEPGSEDNDRQKKENTRDFKPYDAAHSPERAEKSAKASRNTPGLRADSPCLRCRAGVDSRTRRAAGVFGDSRGRAGQPLAGDAARNAYAHA